MSETVAEASNGTAGVPVDSAGEVKDKPCENGTVTDGDDVDDHYDSASSVHDSVKNAVFETNGVLLTEIPEEDSVVVRRPPSLSEPYTRKDGAFSDIPKEDEDERVDDFRREADSEEVVDSSDSISGIGSTPLPTVYSPLVVCDEDYDTDLEIDEDRWLNPEKFDRDTTGRSLYLQACRDLQVQPITSFVRGMQESSMVLSHHGIGTAGIRALAAPLEVNTSIEKIDLEGNSISSAGVNHLCRVLRENVYVTDLNLSENCMESAGAINLCELLHHNRSLERLNLAGNQIGDGAAEHFYIVLTQRNTTLKWLNLRHNLFEDPGAAWFREILAESESLETLDLSWNRFQTKGCVAIADGLKENFGLKEFLMTMSGFGSQGARALGEAIKANRTLKTLDVSNCRLPTEGAASIAIGLQTNDALTTLRHPSQSGVGHVSELLQLGYNYLSTEALYALLVGLDRNDASALKLLDLGNSVVTKEFLELQDSLESQRDLRVLHGGLITDPVNMKGEDPMEAFRRDPMTKLREWIAQAGLRLIDFLKQFDRDQSFSISKSELREGCRKAKILLTEEQVDILMDRLDLDQNGELDFSELIRGDNEHREIARRVSKLPVTKSELEQFLARQENEDATPAAT